MLESRRRKLEVRRDSMIEALCSDGSHLYRHQYPNTPMLEDVCLELDYVVEALADYDVAAVSHAHHAAY